MARTSRDIIRIDQDKCDGCGLCATACAEGAIRIVEGKARLISESYCDGLGACLGECPRGAITIERRAAEAFDEQAVHEHLKRQHAAPAIRITPIEQHGLPAEGGCPGTMLRTLNQGGAGAAGGCPGSAVRTMAPPPGAGGLAPTSAVPDSEAPTDQSQLTQWPVQLRLVPPTAPFLAGAHLLVCADCVPFAVPDFHARYLRGRAVLVGCPKLDDLAAYRQKFRQILAVAQPASLTVLRMEVPCCAALAQALLEARDAAAPQMGVRVDTIGINGDIRREMSSGA